MKIGYSNELHSLVLHLTKLTIYINLLRVMNSLLIPAAVLASLRLLNEQNFEEVISCNTPSVISFYYVFGTFGNLRSGHIAH